MAVWTPARFSSADARGRWYNDILKLYDGLACLSWTRMRMLERGMSERRSPPQLHGHLCSRGAAAHQDAFLWQDAVGPPADVFEEEDQGLEDSTLAWLVAA